MHFPQKVYKLRKLNSLILTEREETKTRYFAPELDVAGLLAGPHPVKIAISH
jgi:hypothetical protein